MKSYDLTFDKTDSVFNISKQFLQGQKGRLYEIRVNESTKDKVDHFLHTYRKVKSNLQVLGNGWTYYRTVYPITQITILVIN